MVKTLKLLKLEGSILELTSAGEKLYALDNSYHLYVIDANTYELEYSKKVSKTHEPLHKYAHSMSISKTGQLHISLKETKKSILATWNEEGLHQKSVLAWHDSDVESATYSPDAKLLATGGQDGCTFVYDTSNFKVVTSLPPRSDYISGLHFSKRNAYLSACGFDKYTVVFDLLRNKLHAVIKTSDVVEKSRFYSQDNQLMLYLIARNGTSIIYDMSAKQTISSENIFQSWPTAIDISQNQKYAIVGSRSENLYLVRLEDNVKMLDVVMEYPGTSVVKFHKDHLLVGAVDGTLAIIDYKGGEHELEVSLKVKDYKKARAVVNENLFLTIHPLMRVFDEDWPEVMKKGVDQLKAGKIEEAVELTDPFLHDPKKHKEFNFYLSHNDTVRQFGEAVETKEYQKAYEMVTKHTYLEKTSPYLKLEDHWNQVFARAKKLLEENPTMNRKQVEQLLKPFEMTVKRDISMQLLQNTKLFEQADQLIKKKDFKGYFSLTEQYGFLKGTDLYRKVVALGGRMFDDLVRFEEAQKFDEARNLAKYLSLFPPYKKAVEEKLRLMEAKRVLLDAIAKNNVKKVYELVEEYESLRGLPQFRKVENDFLKRFDHCKMYAYEGQPKRVLTCFSTFMEISYWQDKVASLMKIAYLNEIDNAGDEADINWKLTLQRYVERFSKDDEIKKILERHKKLSELDKIEGEGNREGYRRHSFVEYIVIHRTSPGDV